MTGYELMTEDQRIEWSELSEARTHGATMRFTALDAIHLGEYGALAERLEEEYRKEHD